jgi:hypothetical protein
MTKSKNTINVYYPLSLMGTGIVLGVVGYFTSMISVGGYTLKIFIALPFIGIALFIWGIIQLIIELFKQKLWYIGLTIGFIIIVSLGFGVYKLFF